MTPGRPVSSAGIEDRSENQVGLQSGTLVDPARFRAFLRHSPCSEEAFVRTRL